MEPKEESDVLWRKILGPRAYLVCKACGWRSEPYPPDTKFFGPGGQIDCPECSKAKRNKNIEAYGSVKVVVE